MRLIDANKLRKDVLDLPNCYNGFSDAYDKALIIDLVDEQPTVDAEPIKHGHWKPFDLTWGRSVYSCTNCGTALEVPTEMGEPIYNYCPNCGAKMGEVV